METLEDVEHRIDAHRLIAKAPLRQRERQVLLWHFGLGDEQLTLQECAERLGRTRERIRQIESKAIRRLRREAKIPEREWTEPVRIVSYAPPVPASVAPLATPSADWGLLAGDLVLTCDTCLARFVSQIPHKGGRVGTHKIERLRELAQQAGWRTEDGDHCPICVITPRFVEVMRRVSVDRDTQAV